MPILQGMVWNSAGCVCDVWDLASLNIPAIGIGRLKSLLTIINFCQSVLRMGIVHHILSFGRLKVR